MEKYKFWDVARLAAETDNVAIATRRLEPQTEIELAGESFKLEHTVLEGHRFAIQPILEGQTLLSWGMPFGRALKTIAPGDYVCTESSLETLKARSLSLNLPASANFKDEIVPYQLDEASFKVAEQLSRHRETLSFMGFRRSTVRGVGTRNVVVLLGTSSLTGSFVKALEAKFKDRLEAYPNLDGVVALAHTEGGTKEDPNNLELVLRTLAGFVIHPNVAAVLCVDRGDEAVTNERLKAYLSEHAYPLSDVPHAFMSLKGNFSEHLGEAETIVTGWLEPANAAVRQEIPVSELKIALQCGGSDAFSGVSGNPLAAWVAREIIRYGGAANLAETDELIGAEAYILKKVKDLETAQKFLMMVERFKERAAWHGTSAEGNPSGGNKLRGLYNIVLKSIGAAMKKDPELRLDAALEYGERMPDGGFYFMDSPGNDLESIAGQIASGCNLIFFITGNGSITNFPFVPTLKFVTTSERFKLLDKDMDVNAGAYLDGTPMDELGKETLDLTIRVASGERTVGEKAQHAQLQLWRNWQQQDASQLESLQQRKLPSGKPIPVKTETNLPTFSFEGYQTERGISSRQLALILPTSLCSGQISRMIASHLDKTELGKDEGISQFVALVHTEGCGVSSGESEALYARTLLGYLTHPAVHSAFLLEHGCEKTHNDYMRHAIQELDLDPGEYGWASIQLDGGIALAREKVERWFNERFQRERARTRATGSLKDLRLGLMTSGEVSENAAAILAKLCRQVVAAGGTVVTPESSTILKTGAFTQTVLPEDAKASLAYGQMATAAGFHVMESPTPHWVETLTGLGATGVETILAYVADHPQQIHPMLPVVQLTDNEALFNRHSKDIDSLLTSSEALLATLARVLSGQVAPKLLAAGNVDFQISRGLLGVSL